MGTGAGECIRGYDVSEGEGSVELVWEVSSPSPQKISWKGSRDGIVGQWRSEIGWTARFTDFEDVSSGKIGLGATDCGAVLFSEVFADFVARSFDAEDGDFRLAVGAFSATVNTCWDKGQGDTCRLSYLLIPSLVLEFLKSKK